MKKVISLCLALVLALSLAVPAFAADDPNSIGYVGNVTVATISVLIEKTADNKVFLNPYGLEVEVQAASSEGAGDAVTSELTVYAAPVKVINAGNTAIQVTPSVTGDIPSGSGAVFSTTPFTAACGSALTPKAAVTKGVFLYMKAGLCSWDSTGEGSVASAFATAATAVPAYDKDNDLLLKKGANAGKVGYTLGTISADLDGLTTYADVFDEIISTDFTEATSSTPAKGPVMEIVICGEANGASTTAWTTTDTVTATVTLAILPVLG